MAVHEWLAPSDDTDDTWYRHNVSISSADDHFASNTGTDGT